MTQESRTRILRAVTGAMACIAILAGALNAAKPAEAANAADFDPGFIISDAQFFDGGAMNEAEIAAFLQQRIGSCLNSNCLNVVKTTTTTRAADAMCGEYQGEPDESAARILYKVQRACGISARVLLVTLQKEQSLVTAREPSLTRLDRAMGYACPDDTTRPGWCDPAFAGLYNQVYRAAWQMKRYGNPPGTTNYFTWFPVGTTTSVLHHPNRDCGTRSVLIRNKATAALYYYTPYTPNAAALSNLYSVGDACSSYGNRNFWRFYSDWFGSPTGPFTPIGNIDAAVGSMGRVQLSGWAHDPNSSDPIDVHVYVDGAGTAARADTWRPDVPAVVPTAGQSHGFNLTIDAPPGNRSVCVYAINVGPGQNTLLGCRTVFVDGVTELGRAPFGALDSAAPAPGMITVDGWAIDPDTASPVDVHVYVDGRGFAIRADRSRADVGSAFPPYGSVHGYASSFAAEPGPHRVCAYAINAGPGANTFLGCRTIEVPQPAANTPPKGNLESVTLTGATLSVVGWAFDPDSPAPIDVHVYVDGRGTAHAATGARPDVVAAFPGRSSGHGFSVSLPVEPGARKVCVYAIDTSGGVNSTLGCRTIAP